MMKKVRKTISPAELYAIEPEKRTYDIDSLFGCYYNHIPEIEGSWEIDSSRNTKVERRILQRIDYDYRRYWELATVWYDGKPVMITQNAGREGDDYAARFITDPDTYFDMVKYLRTLYKNSLECDIELNAERDDLLEFYGDRFIPTAEDS